MFPLPAPDDRTRWTKRFTPANRSGTYLWIVHEGEIRPGDRTEVVARPSHGLTIAEVFDIPQHLSRLLVAGALPVSLRTEIAKRQNSADT